MEYTHNIVSKYKYCKHDTHAATQPRRHACTHNDMSMLYFFFIILSIIYYTGTYGYTFMCSGNIYMYALCMYALCTLSLCMNHPSMLQRIESQLYMQINTSITNILDSRKTVWKFRWSINAWFIVTNYLVQSERHHLLWRYLTISGLDLVTTLHCTVTS